MSAPILQAWTLEQFLAWEEGQEMRWEFDGVRPVAMTGGTLEHETIGTNLRALLHERLRGKPCRVLGPTAKIEVQGRIRYPDALVRCTPASRGATIVPDPVVVFEILSVSTSRTDRIEKLREYQATPSIRRYVILEQDGVAAMVFTRVGEMWSTEVLAGDGILAMPEIGIEIALADIYVDVQFPDPEPDAG